MLDAPYPKLPDSAIGPVVSIDQMEASLFAAGKSDPGSADSGGGAATASGGDGDAGGAATISASSNHVIMIPSDAESAV